MAVRADLSEFELGSMVRLVASLRAEAVSAMSFQSWAQRVATSLHEAFCDSEGLAQTALVRVYATSPLAELPEEELQFVESLGAGDLPQRTPSLVLLGTAGTDPAWNDRARSVGHLVIPLPDPDQIARLPMIAALLLQLGIDVAALTAGEPDVMLKSGDGTCRIFYVAEAAGSALIPDQAFVRAHGIACAVGFGGALPTGEVFAVVMFCTVDVPLPSAELFETVALSMSLATLDLLDVPMFEGRETRTSASSLTPSMRLQARADLSRSLLIAHEQASASEADKAQAALRQARYNAERASALAAVAYRLNGVRTLPEVTSILMSDGLPVLGADGLSLALRDDTNTHVNVALSDGFGAAAASTYARIALDDALPTTLTARTGAVVIIGDIFADSHGFPALLDVARDVGIGAVVSLPMWVGDRLIGALTCSWQAAQNVQEAALESMHGLAAQAAQAIDRSRLLEQERQHSTVLQRSLLTEPPEPDHCQIVVRYLPAAEIAQVGGDWYDSFVQRDGATVLVIGDVVGHDTAAAAAMGQVRGLLRGIAWHSGEAPAAVLTGVDQAMEGLMVQTTASVVVARLEQSRDEEERGVTRLRWSNAGHPPPMIVHADGEVMDLSHVDPDLILGVDPHTERTESVLVLDRDATVIMFTDGLVERRDEDLEQGLVRLRGVVRDLAGLPLDDLCDRMIEQLRDGADDDIALLAVRLFRQDQPRPVEAGPNRVPPGS